MKSLLITLAALALLLTVSCAGKQTVTTPEAPAVVPDIAQRLQKLPRTIIDYDRNLLDINETEVLHKLIEASQLIDEIFWRQISEENPKWRTDLGKRAQTSSQHQLALQYYYINKGRWDRLVFNEPFIAPFGEAGKKPLGAGFYPTDMTKDEFEKWIAAHPEDKENFQSGNTVIRRQGNKLVAIPYSTYYREFLEPAAQKLREAASMTGNASLRDYLTKRADAFLSNDYYQSDFAWMDLDSPIEIVIGPYEVYEDGLFNYKASFESFISVADKTESEKLKVYAAHLSDMERNLPIPDEHKNLNRGSQSPIRVVQQIFTAGDARRGVSISAFNLPNDERVRQAKGSKKVLMKNVMEAKFRQSGMPIASRVMDESQQPLIAFQAYFDDTLFHELSHGLGPGIITGPDGQKVENRILLKNLYSTIEECKADVLGVWNIYYAIDNGLLTAYDRQTISVTNVGLLFRTMRFGLHEGHGQGGAIQWNWYREKGGIVPTADGRFRVDLDKLQEAVKSLANELLMIEATGDFDRATRLLEKYGKSNAEIDSVNERLKDIPVDIAPVFAGAGEK